MSFFLRALRQVPALPFPHGKGQGKEGKKGGGEWLSGAWLMQKHLS